MSNLLNAAQVMVFNIMISATNEFSSFGDVLGDLFNSMFTPLIGIAVALCALWGIYLGFKFWRSGGDENKRKEAKNAVWMFIIGIVVIFVVAVAAPMLISALAEWMSNQG